MFEHRQFRDHEQVVFAQEDASGLRAIIAMHSTVRGPALGGCRFWSYEDDDAALTDVLRLSHGMTFKASMADIPFGGGKSVILGDPSTLKTRELLHALGNVIERLGGRYIAGEDMGVSAEDMSVIGERTAHVMGKPLEKGGSGDPSASTAQGCYEGILVCVERALERDNLTNVRIGVQGLGNVGSHLCRLLAEAGAMLTVADIHADRVQHAKRRYDAQICEPDEILAADVDVFAPCALGSVIDDTALSKLRASIVAGAANNQLASARHGTALHERGILYAPDYVINAGGMIQLAGEMLHWTSEEVSTRVSNIGRTLHEIFDAADSEPTSVVADRIASQRLNHI